MRINVGTKNPAKLRAVQEALDQYKKFEGCEIEGLEVSSQVSEQPTSLEETVRGALNRAKAVFRKGCDYSLGIESGLMTVPYTKTGHMDFCACVIYDGIETCIGLSSAFEFPTEITKIIKEQGVDANEAAFRAGITRDKKIGSDIGIVGLVTDGRITRTSYTQQAIHTAMMQIIKPELYRRSGSLNSVQ